MYICNCCKKIIPDILDEGMRLHYQFQYGSQHDGDFIDLAVCPNCADKIYDSLKEVCQIDPLVPLTDQVEAKIFS